MLDVWKSSVQRVKTAKGKIWFIVFTVSIELSVALFMYIVCRDTITRKKRANYSAQPRNMEAELSLMARATYCQIKNVTLLTRTAFLTWV